MWQQLEYNRIQFDQLNVIRYNYVYTQYIQLYDIMLNRWSKPPNYDHIDAEKWW